MEVLKFDEGIKFGSAGNFAKFDPKGWATPEETFTWTSAQVAQLRFAAQIPRANIRARITLTPFLAKGALKHQDAQFYINGLWFGFVRLTERGTVSAAFPKDAFNPRENLLSIVIPEAATPAQFGMSNDARLLGFAVEQIAFEDG